MSENPMEDTLISYCQFSFFVSPQNYITASQYIKLNITPPSIKERSSFYGLDNDD